MGADLEAVVQQQRAHIQQTLGPLLHDHRRVALVNFPNHHNVGDPAIWLGTTRLLRQLRIRLGYSCEWRTYDRRTLASALRWRTTAILICGGGNLGDQYPAQRAREAVLRDFPSTPVVQLPQSIWFTDTSAARDFALLAQRHEDFTLLVRDRASLEAAHALGLGARLCPDMATALGSLRRPFDPSQDVVWLRRRDRESQDLDAARAAIVRGEAVDWLTSRPEQAVSGPIGRTLLGLNRRYAPSPDHHGRAGIVARHGLPRAYRTLAIQRLDYGVRMLSRGRIVISDRLHGHILATMLGIPNIAVANSNGKIRSYIETWYPTPVAGIRFTDSHEAAVRAMDNLAEGR